MTQAPTKYVATTYQKGHIMSVAFQHWLLPYLYNATGIACERIFSGIGRMAKTAEMLKFCLKSKHKHNSISTVEQPDC